mmetsp:Transcript_58233/g.161131  ORF Transcript_58233/g.161131 Transcript_58233/m.161131 type:complete len:263 (+) Transcript_58233:91-879(+)
MPTGTGTIKKFFPEKDFGFITPDDGTPDLFAPKRTFVGDGSIIREGLKVTFESELEERTNKMKAGRWSALPGQEAAIAAAAIAAASASPSLAGLAAYGYGGMAGYGAIPGATMDNRYSPYGALQGVTGQVPLANYGLLQGLTSPAPAAAAAPAAALPLGWEQVTDPTSGKPYYCNRSTGETSWTPPADASLSAMPALGASAPADGATMADPGAAQAAPAAAAAPAATGALPPGWEAAADPTSGKSYYFNRGTGETTWTMPSA